jgi:hypothetical protein
MGGVWACGVFRESLHGERTVVFDIQMNDMQPIDMRRRIRELQSIPERDRTDAEWDELNELEIRTAPGNRDHDQAQQGRQGTLIGQGRRLERNGKLQGNNKSSNLLRQKPDNPSDGRLLKRQHRRPKRPLDGQTDMAGGPIIVEIPFSGGKSEE